MNGKKRKTKARALSLLVLPVPRPLGHKASYILHFGTFTYIQISIGSLIGLQLITVVLDGLFSRYFEDVTLNAGVDMDGYYNGSALSKGTYTFGSSFTVSYQSF